MRRPCIECGELTDSGSRCAEHEIERPSIRRPGYNNRERVRRAKLVLHWRTEYGEICPGWGSRKSHHVTPPNYLTADHVVPVAAGGAEDGELAILCVECNGRKGRKW